MIVVENVEKNGIIREKLLSSSLVYGLSRVALLSLVSYPCRRSSYEYIRLCSSIHSRYLNKLMCSEQAQLLICQVYYDKLARKD